MTNPLAEAAAATPADTTKPIATATESGENTTAPDEDYSGAYEPIVKLAEVETKTGEEDEDVLFKIRSKLFRFSKELNEWKERGTGDVRILKHKQSKKIRLLMRREKTLKICLNHYVNPSVELKENVGSDRSWVWHGVDYADEERDEALLAIRFRDTDSANQFKDAYNKARDEMKALKTDDSAPTTEDDKPEPTTETKEDTNKEDDSEKKEETDEKTTA